MRKVVQLVVNKANQNITFPTITNKTIGDAPFMAGASATSGLPIEYNSNNSGVARVTTAGLVSIIGAGNVTIEARQAGNELYAAATAVRRSFVVSAAPRPVGVVKFPTAAPSEYSPTQHLNMLQTSGAAGDGAFVWEQPDSIPTPNNNGYRMRFVPRDINAYDYTGVAMTAVIRVVIRKANQQVNIPAITNHWVGEPPFSIMAAVSSRLPLTYQSGNTAVATIAANGIISIHGAGTTIITATQAGNALYNAASAQRTLVVQQHQRPQLPKAVVKFPLTNAVDYNPTQKLRNITLIGGIGDGIFSWKNPDSIPTPNNGGYVVVFTPHNLSAYDYTGVALAQTIPLVVYRAKQVMAFPIIAPKTTADSAFNLNVSVNSGMPIVYSSGNVAVAAVNSAGMVTIKAAGRAIIEARQLGNAMYKPVSMQRVLVVSPSLGTAVDEHEKEPEKMWLYPNPTGDVLYVDGYDAGMVNVYDMSGNLVMTAASGEVYVGHLAAGMYVVAAGNRRGKFLKK
jgi:hypothetical protein